MARRPWHRLGAWVATAAVGLLTPVAVAMVTVPRAAGGIYTPPPQHQPAVPAETTKPAYDPGKPTVAIVLAMEGANAADVLAPFEVLAETDGFNVYTVAETRRLVPLTGGLDIVPDLSFAQLDKLRPSGPDVIVIPQLQGPSTEGSGPVVTWLKHQRALGEPLLVSVCVGAKVLAASGLLDGRPATSNWLGLIGLRRDFPAVQWHDDVRYVDDGDVITTGTVLSGIDGALRIIERTLGLAAAARAAEVAAWPRYSSDPRATAPRLAASDTVGLLSAAFRWDRPTMGVLLTDGVGEMELAAAFRPYTELSFLARPVAVTRDGKPIRSRHHLTFVPRADLATASPSLDRVVVPGADAARAASTAAPLPDGLVATYLNDQPGFAFDGALRDIAKINDVATARWVAKSIQYTVPDPPLSGSSWPWILMLRPLLLAAITITLVIVAWQLRSRRVART